MNDVFKDMQVKVGCDYLSDLPSYKRKVWHEMKRLNHADYEERQLDDFSKYVFGMSYQTIKDVMKQQKGREEQCRKQGCWWKRKEQLAKFDLPKNNILLPFPQNCFHIDPAEISGKILLYYNNTGCKIIMHSRFCRQKFFLPGNLLHIFR